KRGSHHRVALTGFAAEGADYPSGTLFVPRHGNPADLDKVLAGLLAEDALTAQGVASSYDWSGLSVGSQEMGAVRPVCVGLVSGEGVDATGFGFLWYLFDRQLGLRHDRLPLQRLGQIELADFDALVFPAGDYADHVSEKTREALDAWVKSGGVLVAIGSAVNWLQDSKMTTVKRWEPPKPADDPESGEEEQQAAATPGIAGRAIFTPGAALATHMQSPHPLTLGLPAPPAVLVEGSLVLRTTGDPQKDVLVALNDHPVVAGFAFPEAEERLSGALLVGEESRGKGSVVLFAQDPAFRLFWR